MFCSLRVIPFHSWPVIRSWLGRSVAAFYAQIPKKRTGTTAKASWSKEALEKAFKEVGDEFFIRKASKTYNLPFSTSQGRIKKHFSATEPHTFHFLTRDRKIYD